MNENEFKGFLIGLGLTIATIAIAVLIALVLAG